MTTCPHCTDVHADAERFCPKTGKAISVSRLGAGVLVDGQPLQGRVATFPADGRPHRLRIEAEGHAPQELSVEASRDRELFVNLLRPRPSAPDARAPEPGSARGSGPARPSPARPGGMRDIRVVTEP